MKYHKVLLSSLLVILLLGGYASALTLQEAKTIASTSEQGDVVLSWNPGNPWPGELVERDDGTTLWMETNFWNVQSGSGENYMRFIDSTDEVVFYVNMTNVVTNWGGNAFATPNVIFVGRLYKKDHYGNIVWGDKPPVGGYDWFSLPIKGDQVASYDSIWAEVDFELAKSPETLARTGIIMWFEDPGEMPLGEVYIAFSDDYGGIVNTQYPPTDIGTLTETVYINGKPAEITFTVQRTWNWDHFVLEFIPDKVIPEGKVLIDIKPFAQAAVQGIVDDPYSDWTADQITWTSIGFGTYTGSNSNAFEIGWVLHDAKITPVLKTETEEEQGESSSERARRLMFIGYFYHYQYNKLMKSYTELFEKGYGVDESILNTTEYFRKLAEENYQKALEISPYLVYGSLGDLRSYSYLRKAYVYIKSAEETLEKAVEYSELLSEYEVMLAAAKDKNVDESVINEAENARMEAEEEYQLALSLPAGDPAVLTHVDRAHELMKSAVELLRNYVTSLPLLEIRELAAEPQPGDVQFTWWDQFLESPIDLSDGRTVWMQTNFWNIVGGEGEVFMRFVKSTEDFAFYVNLDNVQTQWGGIAWATPEVIFAGRPPKVWWGDKPPVGGHEYLSLPMPASEVSKYNHIWIKADYKVVKREDSLVRFGLLLWFENADGWPVAEVYIPFFDDFGGLVGVSDKTTVGQVTSDAILNGEIVSNVSFKLERGWNPGGWWSFEFIPEEELPSEGIVTIDIKPMIDKVLAEFVNQDITWTSISIGSYSGSSGTGFSYGWIIRDVRIVPPEEVQVPN